jgi:hypothetical protein
MTRPEAQYWLVVVGGGKREPCGWQSYGLTPM